MKTKLVITTIVLNLAFALTVFSQSSFILRNYYPPLVDAPVFDAEGVPLAGPNYLAELWGAATPDLLAPLLVINQGDRREIVPFLTRGYFISSSSYLSVPSVLPGNYAWLQVRAWDARLGATYEDAVAAGLGGYGESPLFYAKGGDPFNQFPIPGPLIGLQSFNLLPEVPEPSTWTLLIWGGTVTWCAMRRSLNRRE